MITPLNAKDADGIERGPDGSPRSGLWDPKLKEGRKKQPKLVIIMSVPAAAAAKATAKNTEEVNMERGGGTITSAGAFMAITVAMFTLLPIYFGAYYCQEENAYRVTMRIIELDSAASPSGTPNGALLGPVVVEAAMNSIRMKPHYHLGYQIETDTNQFSLDNVNGMGNRGVDADEYARHLVNEQTIFGAIVIHANATAAATEAYDTGSATYNPMGAISFYYEEARKGVKSQAFYTTNQYLVLLGEEMLASATSTANAQFAARELRNAAGATGGFNFTALPTSTNPPDMMPPYSSNIIIRPFYYATFNLHPFDQLAGTAATTARQIHLIIFTFLIGLGFKNAFEPLRKKLTVGSEILCRLLVPILDYFWISAMYSLVSLGFLIGFQRKYGHIGFFLDWMMNWITMMGLGFAMEFVLLALGHFVFPFFLRKVIINVSVAFLDVADEDHFYSYAFVVPVWNSVDTAKSIMFGTKNHLGQNLGVNIAWVFVGLAGLSIFTIVQRARETRPKRKERKEKGQKDQ